MYRSKSTPVRRLLQCSAGVAAALFALCAQATSIPSGGVTSTVTPSQPLPGQTIEVLTLVDPTGQGRPCFNTNFTVSIPGLGTQSRNGVRIHNNRGNGGIFRIVTRFTIPNPATGISSLTPTVSWTGCGSGSSNLSTGGATPPSVAAAPQPALSVSKSLSGSGATTVAPGDSVTYRLTYQSVGSDPATNIVLTDTLDADLNFSSCTGNCSTAGQTISWSLGDLPPGSSQSVEVTAEVAPGAPNGTIANTATIDADILSPVTSNQVAVMVNGDPQIDLLKTIDDDVTISAQREAGRRITYRIRYENVGGGDATNLLITDANLPADLIDPVTLGGGDSNNFDVATRTATWAIASVPKGASGVVTLTAQIDPASNNVDINNTVTGTVSAPGTVNPASANVYTLPEPYMELTKRVSPAVVSPGGDLTYTIFYANIGSITGINPTITDTLPANVTPVPGSFSGAYNAAQNTITWTLPDLDPNNQVNSLTYRVTVDPGTPNGTLINSATLAADNLPGILTAVAQATATVLGEPNLVVAKSLAARSDSNIGNGDTVTFEIEVRNEGTEPTDGNVTLADTLPAGLVFESCTGGCSNSGQLVTWTVNDTGSGLSVGGSSGTVTVTARVNGALLSDGDKLSNAASASGVDSASRQYTATSNPVVLNYNLPATVSFTKTATPPTTTLLFPGQQVDYTLQATVQTQTGVDDLVFLDLLPPNLEFIGSSDPGLTTQTFSDGSTLLTSSTADLTAGSRSLTINTRVVSSAVPGDVVPNDATAVFTNGVQAVSAPSTIHTLGDAAIEFTKSRPASQAEVVADEEITYTLTYRNAGRFTLTGITLRDTLPPNVTLVATTPAPSNIVSGPPDALVWSLGSLDPGKSSSVVVKVKVNAGVTSGVLTNIAEIITNETQPKSAQVSSTVRDAPVLTLTKTTPRTTYHDGESVEYTLTYANTGSGDALNAILEDTFPTELSFVSASDGVTPSGGKLTWNLGTLGPGQSGSKVIRATVPNGAYTPPIFVANQADIRSDKARATAGTLIEVTDLPAFTVKKIVDQSTASPGDVLHYTIEVTKTGGPATGVFLSDQLPTGIDPSTVIVDYPLASGNANSNLNADVSSGRLVWDLPNLPSGNATATVHFNTIVESPLANGTELRNRASVIATELSSSTSSNDVLTTIDSAPILSLTKNANTQILFSDPGAGASDSVTYTLVASNTGDAVATGVTVTDTLPQELTIDAASTTGSVSGQTVTWTIPQLVPGNPQTLKVTARVANGVADGTLLSNVALIEAGNPGVGNAVSNPADVTVTGQAVLTLSKTAARASVQAGQSLTYTITYSNVGNAPTAADILLGDLLAPGTMFSSASDGGSESGGLVSWTLPPLDAGRSGIVSVTVDVAGVIPNGTLLSNVASAFVNTVNGPSATAAVQNPVIVSSAPLLDIDKTSDAGDFVVAGGNASYTIDFSNFGSDQATNVVITDKLPVGFNLSGSSIPATQAGQLLTWNLGALPAGTSGSIQISGTIDPSLVDGDILTNSATIASTEFPAPQGDTATVTVQDAKLTLMKSADVTRAASGISSSSTPGERYSYKLDFSNAGRASATNAILVDTLPADVTLVNTVPAATSTAGQTLTWNLGSLAAGQAGSVLITVQANDDLRDGLILHNAATLRSDTTATIASNPVDIPVTSKPELAVIKSSAVGFATPGQTLAWDVSVFNIGSDAAQNVVIRDTLPPDTRFVSATAGGAETAPGSGVVEWDIGANHGPITPNSSVTVSVNVEVATPLPNATSLPNLVSVTGEDTGGNPLPPVATSDTLSVVSSPVLEIDLVTAQPVVSAGTGASYTVSIRNVGNAVATGVAVTALLPSGAVASVIDHGGQFIDNGATALWNIGSLPPSGSIDLGFSVSFPIGTPDGTFAIALAGIDANNAAFNGATTSNLIGSSPLFTFTKQAPNSVTAGDDVSYRLDYFNAGNGVASAAVIEDILPPGTDFVSATNGGTEVSPGVVQWNLGTIAPLSGGNVQLTLRTLAGVPDGSTIGNIAAISSSNGPAVVASASTTERSHTELDVAITAATDPIAPGDQETLQVTWANAGNQNATNAVVSATIPPGSSFVSATGGGTQVGNEVRWSGASIGAGGTLAAGASSSATFTVVAGSTLTDGETLKSVASITADTGLPDSDAATFAIVTSPVWVLAKVADAMTVDTGGSVGFSLNLENLGNGPATGVIVADTLPPGLQIQSADNGGVIDPDANSVTWDLGTVAAGSGPITLRLQARAIAPNASLTNTATVSSNELGSVSARATVSSGAPKPIPALPSLFWLLATGLGVLLLAHHGARAVAGRSRG